MDNTRQRELIHQINNLLGSIYAQAAAARVGGSEDAARRALDIIERAAHRAEAVVRLAKQPETDAQ